MKQVVLTHQLHGLNGETVAAPTTNPWANARATVDVSTQAFTAMVANVRAQLHPTGYQKYEEAPEYWKVIQYPDAVYACTPENMSKVSFLDGIWKIAQQNLAQLYAVGQVAFNTNVPARKTQERQYLAALFADWYVCVMSWVSVAAYATNIQPAFLCPDNATTAVPGGLIAPTRTPGDGLPADLDTLMREMTGLDTASGTAKPGTAFVNSWLKRGFWGPTWMGFTDLGEATGWLDGVFTPTVDPAARSLQQGNGGVDQVWPGEYEGYNAVRPANTSWKTVRNNITDPWYQCYYAFMWFEPGDLLNAWRQHDTSGANATYTRWMLGPGFLRRSAMAWAKWVVTQKIMDVILQSSSWYATNYMAYWDAKGLLTFPVEQVKATQVEIARQKQAVKQQTATQVVNTIMSTGASIAVALAPVPWIGPVAAGATLLISGLTALICKRRRKKRVSVPVMQPLMLRTLSDPACNYFAPGTTLEGSITKFLDQVKAQTAALTAAPAGVVPAIGANDPLVGATVPPSGTAPTSSPLSTPLSTAGSTSTTPAITTSTTSTTAAGSAQLVPTVQTLASAAVQAGQTALNVTPPPAAAGQKQVPWGAIGIGGAALVAIVLIRRR